MQTQPQSIIIYRNPVEAAFWENAMSSGEYLGMVLAIMLFVACFVIMGATMEKHLRKHHRQQNAKKSMDRFNWNKSLEKAKITKSQRFQIYLVWVLSGLITYMVIFRILPVVMYWFVLL